MHQHADLHFLDVPSNFSIHSSMAVWFVTSNLAWINWGPMIWLTFEMAFETPKRKETETKNSKKWPLVLTVTQPSSTLLLAYPCQDILLDCHLSAQGPHECQSMHQKAQPLERYLHHREALSITCKGRSDASSVHRNEQMRYNAKMKALLTVQRCHFHFNGRIAARVKDLTRVDLTNRCWMRHNVSIENKNKGWNQVKSNQIKTNWIE